MVQQVGIFFLPGMEQHAVAAHTMGGAIAKNLHRGFCQFYPNRVLVNPEYMQLSPAGKFLLILDFSL